ncbi:MAG: hypothetical protein OEM97_10445, partial [Acidimicrobiia bacterium]|nr:hypothetical protein [Acidimicrobiia bacterium]
MRPSAVWTSLLLMLAILGAACSRSSDAETDLPSLPSPASTQPTTTVTEPVTADVPGTATPSNAELEPDVAAAAESTCQAFTGAR